MSDVAVTCEQKRGWSFMACSANEHMNTPQSQPFIWCGFALPSGPLLQGPSLADIRQHATDTRLQLFCMPLLHSSKVVGSRQVRAWQTTDSMQQTQDCSCSREW
jgi:hypothetical protein